MTNIKYHIRLLLTLLPYKHKFNAARAVSSTSFSKQTSLKSSTLPKNNKVHVKLGIAHQAYQGYLELPQYLRWSAL